MWLLRVCSKAITSGQETGYQQNRTRRYRGPLIQQDPKRDVICHVFDITNHFSGSEAKSIRLSGIRQIPE
jgi:hypothetical protein